MQQKDSLYLKIDQTLYEWLKVDMVNRIDFSGPLTMIPIYELRWLWGLQLLNAESLHIWGAQLDQTLYF
jgi:hypothetical protein